MMNEHTLGLMKDQNLTIDELKYYKDKSYNIVKCPICGKYTLDFYYICNECNNEFDVADEVDFETYEITLE